MLRQSQHEITIATRGRAFHDFTEEISALLHATKIQTGQVTLHLQHTSASLLIQENADPDVRRDFESFFARLVPDGDEIFIHTAEGEDDMSAHIRTALTAVNLTVPITRGELALGTWQGIYLWEHRTQAHRRRVVVHFIGE
jgi:secondary thiamine-phosphate synthase enzyme